MSVIGGGFDKLNLTGLHQAQPDTLNLSCQAELVEALTKPP
jgi:hypothetical protein